MPGLGLLPASLEGLGNILRHCLSLLICETRPFQPPQERLSE